jgi:predicted dehydrogenase
MTASKSPVRIGILGAARIARQFVEGARNSPAVNVTTVAARDPARAAAFARELGLARTAPSYEALLADPELDAIYVPLPNALHAEWAIKAADAGRHVLCEKPLAVTEADAKAMFAAARRNRVHLVEGFPYLAQPQTRKAREIVAAGTIGRLRLIRTSFGVPFSDLNDIRFSAPLAGGSVTDAASYAVSMILMIAGERPSRVTAVAQWAETGVDRSMIALIEFPSGLLAQAASSFATAYHRHAHIAGETGIVETTFLNHPPIGGPPVVVIRRGATSASPIDTLTLDGGNGFTLMAQSFGELVRSGAGHWTGAGERESIDIAATLEAILASARSGAPVTLAS